MNKKNIQERIEQLNEYLKEFDDENFNIIFLDSKKAIVKGEKGKEYHINFEKKICIEKIVVSNIKTDCKVHDLKSKKITSKRGIIKSKNYKTVLAPAILILLSTGLFCLHSNKQAKIKECLNQKLGITIESNEIIEDMKKIQESLENGINQISITNVTAFKIQTTNVEVSLENDMRKRELTEQALGHIIEKYSKRYGIPSSLAKALISQETNNEFENPGCLTKIICGNKLEVPIIEKTEEDKKENKEYDKIYLISDYPERKNFNNEQEYKKALQNYQKELQESKELEKQEFEIYTYDQAKNNQEINIKTAMILLAYSIYQCDLNVTNGIRAYNCGISAAYQATDYDIQNGTITIGDPLYNQNVYSHLYPDELKNLTWTFRDLNSKEEKYIEIQLQFTNIKDMNNEIEKENKGR